METCEVLVVGGGPAGSTCAWELSKAGVDVLLLDKELFPRQKPCAGWITPEVLEMLAIDADEYRYGRVLQEFRSFRTGVIGGGSILVRYGAAVSYGVRRSEFDHYLLHRSRVRQSLGEPIKSIERREGAWVVNDRIRARMLVGAGGHFCPVARLLGAKIGREEVIVAQSAESAISPAEGQLCRIKPDTPELFFCKDLKGYGWMIRKGSYVNVGLGRVDSGSLAHHVKNFCTFLMQRHDLPLRVVTGFQGHSYRWYESGGRRNCVGDATLLIGDAAGLARPASGEGILPSVESALLAAKVVLEAHGDYRRENLEPYATGLDSHCGSQAGSILSHSGGAGFLRYIGARMITNHWFARHIVLDRWFLHAGEKGDNVTR